MGLKGRGAGLRGRVGRGSRGLRALHAAGPAGRPGMGRRIQGVHLRCGRIDALAWSV